MSNRTKEEWPMLGQMVVGCLIAFSTFMFFVDLIILWIRFIR